MNEYTKAYEELRKHEKHFNHAQTSYWCEQYRMFAEKCAKQVDELEQSFELYRKASMVLMQAYKRAHPEVPENVWPDVTKVNMWAASLIEEKK